MIFQVSEMEKVFDSWGLELYSRIEVQLNFAILLRKYYSYNKGILSNSWSLVNSTRFLNQFSNKSHSLGENMENVFVKKQFSLFHSYLHFDSLLL